MHRFRAMATYFEFSLWGKDESYLRSCAEEAEAEVHRVERHLSLYREESEIYEVNARAFYRPVPLDPRTYSLMKRACEISAVTNGAFDITAGPLIKAWGFVGDQGSIPDPDVLDLAREVSGYDKLIFDDDYRTVQFAREGCMVDLGAIGKGYALDQAAEILTDLEIPGALLHGGTSSVVAVGTNIDGAPYNVAIHDPRNHDEPIRTVALSNKTLSVSGLYGKSFTDGTITYGHVIDPSLGEPVQQAHLSAVVCNSATDGDALSTALLVRGASLIPSMQVVNPTAYGLVAIITDTGELTIQSNI